MFGMFNALEGRGATHRVLLIVVAVWFSAVLPSEAAGDKSPYDWAVVRLDYAREEKVEQLRAFCDRTCALAHKATSDPIVLACFEVNLKYSRATTGASTPDSLATRVAELRNHFDAYYIANYLAFYNMLFIDLDGNVFYSIREQSRFADSSTKSAVADSQLRNCLQTRPEQETFVDFHLYEPSSEVAAFFVEPIRNDAGELVGWLALQCAINRVNTLFAYTEDLGYTGETFLVNQEGFMLTESNFEGARRF